MAPRHGRGDSRPVRWTGLTSRLLKYAALSRGAVERALWPVCCVFCGARIARESEGICHGCRADLPWTEPRFELPVLSMAAAPLRYAYPVDAAIRMFKFRRRLDYAPALADLLIDTSHVLPATIDAVVPVPLHWRRQALRGFNQAEELAGPLGRLLGVPIARNVARIRHTPSQSGLGAGARRRNLITAFRIRGHIDAGHLVIVDDVITTGATCSELGRALLGVGVKRVSALCVARVVTPG